VEIARSLFLWQRNAKSDAVKEYTWGDDAPNGEGSIDTEIHPISSSPVAKHTVDTSLSDLFPDVHGHEKEEGGTDEDARRDPTEVKEELVRDAEEPPELVLCP